jgi:hypothetical protein
VTLKLNGTHQLLVYADDANLLGGNVGTINKNTEPLRMWGLLRYGGYFPFKIVYTGSGANSASYPVSTGGPYKEGKAAGA